MTAIPRTATLIRRAALGLAVLGLAAAAAHAATRTITGRIVYGMFNDDLGETSDPNNFIGAGSPVAHVTVQLNDGAGIKRGDDITDDDGAFSIQVTGTPNLTLVTKAKNDYVSVKQDNVVNLPTDDVIKTKYPITVDWANCPADATCDVGTVTVTNDAVDIFWTGSLAADIKNYASRAFYVTTAAHVAGQHVEDLYGAPLPGDKASVRMGLGGIGGTAYYYTLTNTVHLARADATVFWHEYGHFIEDKIAAFGTLPSYSQHSACTEITDTLDSDPNVCWSWHEGLATWLAVINSGAYLGGYAGQQASMCRFADPDGDGTLACQPEFETELEICSATSIAGWTEPKAVESVVAKVLWDLVDDVQDAPASLFVDEIADLEEADVIEVITSDMNAHNPCDSLTELYTHPVGLDDFWTQFRSLHPGVVPDLYAAYAHNGVATGAASDLLPPDPVTIEVTSHLAGQWSNDPTVDMTITRGNDDVSGSYFYFVSSDTSPTGAPDVAGTESFRSKLAATPYGLAVPDGAGQYVHANTLDMAGHPGTGVAHAGPFKIDSVPPYWTGRFLPAADSTFVLGYTADLAWASADDLSGVSSVTITFEPATSPVDATIATGQPAVGTYTWYVDGVTAADGTIVFKAFDRAGNAVTHRIPVHIVPPFVGSNGRPDYRDARVISADLDRSGTDERILAVDFGGGGEIQVLGAAGRPLQTIAWNPADDLYAADYDRDGDLDVITVSRNLVGGTTVLEILDNNNGTLGSAGVAIGLGVVTDKKVRVAPLFTDGMPILVTFGVGPGATPVVRSYRTSAGFPAVTLTGLTGVAGDWECGDVDGDGDVDFAALGTDAAGRAGLFVFENSGGAFTRRTIERYPALNQPNLDLADENADGLPDVFVMYDDGGTVRTSKVLLRSGTTYSLLISAVLPDQQLAQGDGYIVDLEADASSEAVAMGLTEASTIGSWYLRNNDIVGLAMEGAPAAIVPLHTTDTTWGDQDGDGDLDVFFKGFDAQGLALGSYANQIGDYVRKNNAPPAPQNLTSTYDAARGGYVFTWSAPGVNTDETPEAGFMFELRVGTTNGGSEILSWVHQAGPGLHGSGRSRFLRLARGVYYAQVRTVDSGWRRSVPSATHQTTP